MKAIMMTVRLWWFYLTYKGIKKAEIRKRFAKDFKGKIFECVSKTNWKKDLMKIPEEEREFFKQFVGKVGLCFECDKVEEIVDDDISNRTKTMSEKELLKASCLSEEELVDYLPFSNLNDNCEWVLGYAVHVTKVEPFDKPKEIKEFRQYCDKHFSWWKNKCLDCKAYTPDTDIEDYCNKNKLALTSAPQSFMFIEV